MRQCVFCNKGADNLKLSGHFNTKRFNILGFYVVSTQSTYVLCVDSLSEKTAVIYLCNINSLVFINSSVYCAVHKESLKVIQPILKPLKAYIYC